MRRPHTATNIGAMRKAFRPNIDLLLTIRRADAATLFPTLLQTPVMTLNPQSKYPSRRAYVVKVRSDAKPGTLAGRLENLVTGRQREFASGQELLQSITSDLEASTDEPSGDATGK